MRRRDLVLWPVASARAIVAGAALAACQPAAEQQTRAAASGQTQDPRVVASGLLEKTTNLVDAIGARSTPNIERAKADLAREADKAEDAVKSATGPAANRVNAAVAHIRAGMLSNDVSRLEQARALLQQAAQ